MSEVNKLDNKQCPFDPEQYKAHVTVSYKIDNDVSAPVGSFPWAMIQVYLGNNVRRNVWDANTYIYGDNIGKDDQAVKQGNKEGTFAWNPEQQDMLACDWTKMGCMLSFDLEIGTSKYGNGESQDWGYMTKAGDLSSGESTFGVLTNLQSTIGVGGISDFRLYESTIGTFDNIVLLVDTQNQPDLGSKALEVTANGLTYNLGSTSKSTTDFVYTSDGAKQLGDLLKQNVGNTLHFFFNWK
ncbi:conserved protein of unknown function [Xenorhabdus poinarii G6]|uniref:Uncharacterized protein n=1 Tax=Xenorhabdus poinarii G6 TaxID=1354304 RepID=A0A068R692_9GAMM|nr:hypothetical protein [Xenorhabdus poinarii]CDG21645.1 conserved protein of unknown function [Xenorhabdus poinarii G6]